MRRTSCYKITFRTSNRPVSHLPAVLEKACHEPAERKIAASHRVTHGSAHRCSGQKKLRTDHRGHTRPPLPDRRPYSGGISSSHPALAQRPTGGLRRSSRVSPAAGNPPPASPPQRTSPATATASVRRSDLPKSPRASKLACPSPSLRALRWHNSS